ncbi:sugar transferase [Terrilactibacillus sp. S3-3]|nr:sugar transferase [Terrilactibacillus sp. S3-3]
MSSERSTFLSIIGLILLSPLFLGIAICIKLEDRKAPVIFKQTRVGKDERTFTMYKFRSMVPQAEQQLSGLLDKNEADGAMFKMKHDPRVTAVGRVIRRTSLDELPQLWNVLKGDMSLVGPRPPLPREVSQYTRYHKQRLRVKPGCTGLWQVSGRSDVGFEEMVKLDLDYIMNRSTWFDLKILIKTAKQIIFPKNAY